MTPPIHPFSDPNRSSSSASSDSFARAAGDTSPTPRLVSAAVNSRGQTSSFSVAGGLTRARTTWPSSPIAIPTLDSTPAATLAPLPRFARKSHITKVLRERPLVMGHFVEPKVKLPGNFYTAFFVDD